MLCVDIELFCGEFYKIQEEQFFTKVNINFDSLKIDGNITYQIIGTISNNKAKAKASSFTLEKGKEKEKDRGRKIVVWMCFVWGKREKKGRRQACLTCMII